MRGNKKSKSARHALHVLLFCCSGLAAAQTAPDLQRAESLLREGRAAESYALLEPLEFQHSGNPDFDYWLGIAALESGRADRATLALERALIVNPDFLGARLDLARAYFTLGDMDRARQEFELVLAQSPPPPARATIERYLGEIESRTQTGKARWSAYLEGTVGRDSNVNNSTSSSVLFVPLFGLDLVLAPTSVKSADNYLAFGGGAELILPVDVGLSVFAGLDYRQRLNAKQDMFDFSQFNGRVGLQYQQERNLYRLGFDGGEYRLDNKRHYENRGAAVEWRRAIDERNVASVFAVANRLRFPNPELRGNSADQWLAGGGWLRSFNPDRTTYVFATAYGGHEHDTDNRIDGARDMWGLRLVGQYNIQRALDVYATIGAHFSEYDVENFVFQRFRRDLLYEFSLGMNWRPARDWTVRPQFAYTNVQSTIPINKFDRYDVSITLRRDFR